MSKDKPIIDDPLARFFAEENSRESGIKNPVTGIREQYDTAERQRLRHDEIKRKSQVSARVLKPLMETELGREWVYDKLVDANVFGTPFNVDPIASAYNAGALFTGRMLEAEVKKHAPENYFLMLREAHDRTVAWDEVVADK